jgi:sarcosine oxidase delta subunit
MTLNEAAVWAVQFTNAPVTFDGDGPGPDRTLAADENGCVYGPLYLVTRDDMLFAGSYKEAWTHTNGQGETFDWPAEFVTHKRLLVQRTQFRPDGSLHLSGLEPRRDGSLEHNTWIVTFAARDTSIEEKEPRDERGWLRRMFGRR